jgi:hypothetical protein
MVAASATALDAAVTAAVTYSILKASFTVIRVHNRADSHIAFAHMLLQPYAM